MRLNQAKFHFIGIGGIGMCGLAELLHNMGAQVQGSDLAENSNTEHLKKIGVKIFKGHAASNLGSPDVVVYSSAVKFSNPEVIEARAQQIPLIPRAEALAEIMNSKRGIALAGTHGKTTTTSMVSSIFINAEQSPTIVVGGRLDVIKSTALLGEGEWLIAEADESDGSFHKLAPEIAVITNIDSDHLDHFKTFENVQKSFYDFALKIPFYGVLIVCGDDPSVKKLFSQYPKRILFYGMGLDNDFIVEGSNSRYKLYRHHEATGKKELLGDFKVPVPGIHNALNGVAAIVVGLCSGLSFEKCRDGLEKFSGVDRRFQLKGEKRNVKVYDDYGHHPTEIKAVLQAFREKFPHDRIIVYFQPHRFTRTQDCWSEFTTCFSMADQVLIGDIYPAGELPIAGVHSKKLAQEIKHNNVMYFEREMNSAQGLAKELKSGDVFVTLGAGDGWKLGLEVLDYL